MDDRWRRERSRARVLVRACARSSAKMLTHFNNITLDVRGYLFEGRRVINKNLSDGVDASRDR